MKGIENGKHLYIFYIFEFTATQNGEMVTQKAYFSFQRTTKEFKKFLEEKGRKYDYTKIY